MVFRVIADINRHHLFHHQNQMVLTWRLEHTTSHWCHIQHHYLSVVGLKGKKWILKHHHHSLIPGLITQVPKVLVLIKAKEKDDQGKRTTVVEKVVIQLSPSIGCKFVHRALSNYDVIDWVSLMGIKQFTGVFFFVLSMLMTVWVVVHIKLL